MKYLTSSKLLLAIKDIIQRINHVNAKRYDTFAVIPSRNKNMSIYRTKGKLKKDEKTFARRIKQKINSGDCSL